MAVMDSLEKAQTMVKDLKKKIRYSKENRNREAAANLQFELMKCRGQLEVCRKDYQRTIRNQSESIQKGIVEHHDTLVQEQILWDSAIGYMLVQDAIFALSSVNSYDSVSHAYEMLDSAMKQISGRKTDLSKFFHLGGNKKRNEYGFITSKTAIQEKEELLNSFFEELKLSGDIEECFRNAVATQEYGQIGTNTPTDRERALSDAMNELRDVDVRSLDNMKDYKPSKD